MNRLAKFVSHGIDELSKDDPALYELLEGEYERQTSVLTMVPELRNLSLT